LNLPAKRRVMAMNVCFAAGLAVVLPWFAAGVLAHWWGPARGTLWSSHHAYAVRTFWFGVIGMLALLIGGEAGLVLLVLVWVWCAARVARGFLAWDREEWITDPGRFL
jgi:uncharacterized membrane protein